MPTGSVCGDCELFDVTKGTVGKCCWGIRECKGPSAKHAEICPLFMKDGKQFLLDCPEQDLPEWARSDQLTLEL